MDGRVREVQKAGMACRPSVIPAFFVFSLLLLCVAGCPGVAPLEATQQTQDSPRGYEGSFEELAPNLWAYTSSPRGFRTRSYLLRGPEGVVIVDTQFLPSAAEELLDFCREHFGAPPTAAFVLHANPDKFNGTATFQRAGVEVLSSPEVIAAIPAVHALRSSWFEARYRPDYPTVLPAPSPLPDGDAIERGGLRFRLWRIAGATSEAHIVVAQGPHLFSGDLVANGTHAWTELGNLAHWRRVLEHFEGQAERFAGAERVAGNPPRLWVHPGRGSSGSPALLRTQGEYLLAYEQLLQDQRALGHSAEQARGPFLQALYDRFPALTFRRFAALGFAQSFARSSEPGSGEANEGTAFIRGPEPMASGW